MFGQIRYPRSGRHYNFEFYCQRVSMVLILHLWIMLYLPFEAPTLGELSSHLYKDLMIPLYLAGIGVDLYLSLIAETFQVTYLC